MSRAIIYLCLATFFVTLLVGCVGLTSISDLLEADQPESDPSSEVQDSGPVELVLVEPTPTATPRSENTIPPILFVSNRGTSATNDIYQINADGSGLIRLTTEPGDESDPIWSPDRKEIAFSSDRKGASQIYLLSMEDLKVMQLTDHLQGAVSPTWSPDGEKIAFVEQDPKSDSILVINSQGGSPVTRIPVKASGVDNLAWASSGNIIAFSAQVAGLEGERDIFSFEMDENLLVNLTNHPGNDDNPSWAPNGERLLFQTDRDGDDNIYVMQANGSLQTPLTNDPASDIEPDWTSDGRSVVFSSDRSGVYDLHLMSDSGAEQRALASFPADDRQPRWPPLPPHSADEMVVAAGISPPPRDLVVVSTTGTQKTVILKSDESDDTMPDLSPDGSRIVFASNGAGNYDIYVMAADGSSAPVQLTVHPGADMHPSWSPDGGKIAFESKRDEGDWGIWVINVDGSELRNLTAEQTANDGNPSWSPDGKEIAFSSDRGNGFDIYLMDADGSGVPLQLTDLRGNENHPSWSPDGRDIVFRHTNPSTGQTQLYIVSSDGRAIQPLFTSQANDDTPAWSPDGRWIAFASDRANPGRRNEPGKFDIYIYDLTTGVIAQVTQDLRDVRYPAWAGSKESSNPNQVK